MYLSVDASSSSLLGGLNYESELLLGGYNLSRVGPNATWHYAPLVDLRREGLGYWAVELTGCPLTQRDGEHPGKGQWIGDACEAMGGSIAVVDSGTTLLVPPEWAYDGPSCVSYVDISMHVDTSMLGSEMDIRDER